LAAAGAAFFAAAGAAFLAGAFSAAVAALLAGAFFVAAADFFADAVDELEDTNYLSVRHQIDTRARQSPYLSTAAPSFCHDPDENL